MINYLSKFEQNPRRDVDFLFIKGLLNEIGAESFDHRFDWRFEQFVKNCFIYSPKFNADDTDVFDWISRFNEIVEDALNDERSNFVIKADIRSFADDLEDIEDYLIERIND